MTDEDQVWIKGIEVTVATAAGAPVEGHIVVIDSPSGLSDRGHTDSEGKLDFSPLAPGSYRILAPFVTSDNGFVAGFLRKVEFADGALSASVELVVPDSSMERHVWLELEGTEDFSGWFARTTTVEWTELTREGEVPIDLSTEGFSMRFRALDGRRWQIKLPSDAPDGTRVQLPWGPARISGTVRDGEGAPVAGCEVRATPIEESAILFQDRSSLGCVTDADGSFTLPGLDPVKYVIRLNGQPDGAFDGSPEEIQSTTFSMTEPAGIDTRLELGIPALKVDLGLHLTVLRADGTPWANAIIGAISEVTALGLEIRPSSVGTTFSQTGSEGTFEFLLARGHSVIVFCTDPVTEERIATETLEVPATGDLPPLVLRARAADDR